MRRSHRRQSTPKYTEVDITDPPRPESEVSGIHRSPKPVECGARYFELPQIAMTFVTVGFSTLIPLPVRADAPAGLGLHHLPRRGLQKALLTVTKVIVRSSVLS